MEYTENSGSLTPYTQNSLLRKIPEYAKRAVITPVYKINKTLAYIPPWVESSAASYTGIGVLLGLATLPFSTRYPEYPLLDFALIAITIGVVNSIRNHAKRRKEKQKNKFI